MQKGLFWEALTYLRRATGTTEERFFEPVHPEKVRGKHLVVSNESEAAIETCERFSQLEPYLPSFLDGSAKPANPIEWLELARLCVLHKKLNVAGARFFQDAFTEQPELASNLNTQDRYNAACAAALA